MCGDNKGYIPSVLSKYIAAITVSHLFGRLSTALKININGLKKKKKKVQHVILLFNP